MKFKKPLVNAFLRLLNISTKGLFIVLLPNFVDNNAVLQYSNIQSVQQFLIILLGLDLYKLSYKSQAKSYSVYPINQQLKSHFRIYLVLLPIIVWLMSLIFPISITIIGVALFISEHLVQESHRVLIYFNKHLVSSGFLLFKSLCMICALYASPSLLLILSIILLSNILYLIVLLIFHLKAKKTGSENTLDINSKEIGYTFLGALLYRFLFTLDRPLMTYFDYENITLYSYYAMIAMTLIIFFDAIILSFVLPRLYQEKSPYLRLVILGNTSVKIMVFASLLVLMTTVIYYIIDFETMNLPILFDLVLFREFIVLYTIITLGLLFSGYMNSRGYDKAQLYINLIGFGFWLLLITTCVNVGVILPRLIILHSTLLIFKFLYLAKIEIRPLVIK